MIYIYVYIYNVYVYFPLIVLVYKDEQQMLQITLCEKNTNNQQTENQPPSVTQKVYRPVKYCVSKESNSRAIAKYCKSNLQKEVKTHLRLKPKLRRLNF